MSKTIGLISPGKMGASVGAAAAAKHRVIWAGAGRSEASHQRAGDAGLVDCGTLEQLVNESDIILSVAPPHDAVAVAEAVAALKFAGLFADCNAISPAKTRAICELFQPEHFVDGGIIGGPAWTKEAGTNLYLSGERAQEVASLFDGSPLAAPVISTEIGAASALKMTFAAYTKGSTALLTAILAVAEKEGVRHALEQQWGDAFSSRTSQQVVANSEKAWRFAGEMREIAETFSAAGMPGGFHNAAAEVFDNLAAFKDNRADTLETLLEELFRHQDG